MSFQGFYQHLCKNGHYWTKDAVEAMYDDETPICPKCGEKSVWKNCVDQTNGSYDEYDIRIDGYVELEIKSQRSGICGECGEKHICETIYKIPKDVKNEN